MDAKPPKVKFSGIIKFPEEGFSNRRNTDVEGVELALKQRNPDVTEMLTLTRKVDGVATLVVALIAPVTGPVRGLFAELEKDDKVLSWPWDEYAVDDNAKKAIWDSFAKNQQWQRKALRAFLLPHTIWSKRIWHDGAGGVKYSFYVNISLYSPTEKSLQIPHYLRRGIEDYIGKFYHSILSKDVDRKRKAEQAEFLQCLAFRTELIVGKAEPSAATTFISKNRRMRDSAAKGTTVLFWPSLVNALKEMHFAEDVLEKKWRDQDKRREAKFKKLGLLIDDPYTYTIDFDLQEAGAEDDVKQAVAAAAKTSSDLVTVTTSGGQRNVSVFAESSDHANTILNAMNELLDQDPSTFLKSVKPPFINQKKRSVRPDKKEEQVKLIDDLKAKAQETYKHILTNNISSVRAKRKTGFEKVYGLLNYCIEAAWNSTPIIDGTDSTPHEMACQQLGLVVLDLHVGDVQEQWLQSQFEAMNVPESYRRNWDTTSAEQALLKKEENRVYHKRYALLKLHAPPQDAALQVDMMHTVRAVRIWKKDTVEFSKTFPPNWSEVPANAELYVKKVEFELRKYVTDENGEGFMIIQDTTSSTGTTSTKFWKLKDFSLIPVFPDSYTTAFGFWDPVGGPPDEHLEPSEKNNQFLRFMTHINGKHFRTVKNLKPFGRKGAATWLTPKTLKLAGRSETPYEPLILTMAPWGVFKNVNGLANVASMDTTWLSDMIKNNAGEFGNVSEYLLWVQYVRSCRIRLMCTPITKGTREGMRQQNRKRIKRVYDEATDDGLKKHMDETADNKLKNMVLQLFGLAKLTDLAFQSLTKESDNTFDRTGQIVRQLVVNAIMNLTLSVPKTSSRYTYALHQDQNIKTLIDPAKFSSDEKLLWKQSVASVKRLLGFAAETNDITQKTRNTMSQLLKRITDLQKSSAARGLDDNLVTKLIHEAMASSYPNAIAQDKYVNQMQLVLMQKVIQAYDVYHPYSVARLPSLPYNILDSPCMLEFVNNNINYDAFEKIILEQQELSYIHDIFKEADFKNKVMKIRAMTKVNKDSRMADFCITSIPEHLVFDTTNGTAFTDGVSFDNDAYDKFTQYYETDYADTICADCHDMAAKLRVGNDCRFLLSHITKAGVNFAVQQNPSTTWGSLDADGRLKAKADATVQELPEDKEYTFFSTGTDNQQVHLELNETIEKLLREKIAHDNGWGVSNAPSSNYDEDLEVEGAVDPSSYGVQDVQLNSTGAVVLADPFEHEIEVASDEAMLAAWNGDNSNLEINNPLVVNAFDIPDDLRPAVVQQIQEFKDTQDAIDLSLDDDFGSSAAAPAPARALWASDGLSAWDWEAESVADEGIQRAIAVQDKPQTAFVRLLMLMHRNSIHAHTPLPEFLREKKPTYESMRELGAMYAQVCTKHGK